MCLYVFVRRGCFRHRSALANGLLLLFVAALLISFRLSCYCLSLSLSEVFSLSFGFCGVGWGCFRSRSFYSSLSLSLSSRRALKRNVSLSLSLSLSLFLSLPFLSLSFASDRDRSAFFYFVFCLRFLKEKFSPQKLWLFRVSFFLTFETVDFFFPKQTHLHAFLKSVLWGNR
jgi:hypothetical protein